LRVSITRGGRKYGGAEKTYAHTGARRNMKRRG
jgi:hypothetical protein